MGVHFKPGKTNKSFSKRFKITRKGKVLSRKAGKDHFNARASRAKQLNDKGQVEITLKPKARSRFLPQS